MPASSAQGEFGLAPRERARRCRLAGLHLDSLSTRFTKATRARTSSRDRAVLRALVRSFTEPPEPSS